jgi:hypothetical protein
LSCDPCAAGNYVCRPWMIRAASAGMNTFFNEEEVLI